MKTIEELKAMKFIPLRSCSICNCVIGWYPNDQVAWFESSCDCSSGGGHYDSWETVQETYNKYNNVNPVNESKNVTSNS